MSISDAISSQIWEFLREGTERFKSLEKARQKHIILGGITLAIGLGLFFSAFAGNWAAAQSPSQSGTVAAEVMDPLAKIGKGIEAGQAGQGVKACKTVPTAEVGNNLDAERLETMLAGYPIAKMIPALAKRDKASAAFLVAIARKESSWGVHAPQRAGRDCYNYWGYKGGYNPSPDGYSCFDSPEQAVSVVGGRISHLLGQHIDTPARMVVWKCGGDCGATGGQAAAEQWVRDVAFYYNKLQS
jgi:hypothetical protein